MLEGCEELFTFSTENVLTKVSGATKMVERAERMNLSDRATLAWATSLREFQVGAPSSGQMQPWASRAPSWVRGTATHTLSPPGRGPATVGPRAQGEREAAPVETAGALLPRPRSPRCVGRHISGLHTFLHRLIGEIQRTYVFPTPGTHTPEVLNKCWRDVSDEFIEIKVNFSRGKTVLNLKALSVRVDILCCLSQ